MDEAATCTTGSKRKRGEKGKKGEKRGKKGKIEEAAVRGRRRLVATDNGPRRARDKWTQGGHPTA